jgi:hypothetical protein
MAKRVELGLIEGAEDNAAAGDGGGSCGDDCGAMMVPRMATILTLMRPGTAKGGTSTGARGTAEEVTTTCLKLMWLCTTCPRSQRGRCWTTPPALWPRSKETLSAPFPHHLKTSSSTYFEFDFIFIFYFFIFPHFIFYFLFLDSELSQD